MAVPKLNESEGRSSVSSRQGGLPIVFLVKRISILEVGGFDEELPYAEDYDLWLRLAESHNHFAAVGERLVIKHDFGDQQMTTNPEIGTQSSEILDRRWGPVIQRHLG